MATLPKGWTRQPQSGDDPKIYYQATIGNYGGIAIVARSDEFGNYELYELGFAGALGTPFYSFNNSGTKTGGPGNLNTKDFNVINQSVRQSSFQINQSVGNEKTDISNTNGYKSIAQSQENNPDRPTGTSTEQTSGNGGGSDDLDTNDTPASTTENDKDIFRSTSETFNTDTPYKNTSWLKYPEDMNGYQDRIVIVQKQYKSVAGKGEGARRFSEIPINYNTLSEDRNTNNLQDILGTVVLPMPNDISETNVTTWGEDSLSTLGALLGQAALKGGIQFTSGDFGGAGKTLVDAFSKMTGEGEPAVEAIKQFLSLNAAASIVKKAGVNFDPEAFRSRITGTAINNNLELLFQGPKLRSFGFQFKMIPRSENEARNIRYIIKFFKKGMAAKRNASQPFFLGAPNVFDIHFRSGNNSSPEFTNDLKSIGKIKTCALNQCVVNYTPDGFYAAFQDSKVNSQPIAVTMQLTFTELTPLYNDNYIDDDTVGWDDNSFSYNK